MRQTQQLQILFSQLFFAAKCYWVRALFWSYSDWFCQLAITLAWLNETGEFSVVETFLCLELGRRVFWDQGKVAVHVLADACDLELH